MKKVILAFAVSLAFMLGVRMGVINALLIILLQVSMMALAFLLLTKPVKEEEDHE